MKPGDKLPTEKQLIAELGVSRTCVREAMKSLESLRLISIRPKVGAMLLETSKTAIFDAEHLSQVVNEKQSDALIEFRRIIEVGLAGLAAERALDEDLVAMRRAVDDHQKAVETGQIAFNADLDFHMAIARAARNSVASEVLKLILEPLAEQRKATDRIPKSAEEGLRDHRRILKALEEQNPEKAQLAMAAHMNTAERYHRIAAAGILTNA